MAFWLAIGPIENWDYGLEQGGVWGVTERYQKAWDRVKKNDVLFFYAMRPVKSIIGYGTIRSKERQSKPFWPEERKEGITLWPLHLRIEVVFCLPRDKWEVNRIPLPSLSQGITIQRALQEIREGVAQDLLGQFPRDKG